MKPGQNRLVLHIPSSQPLHAGGAGLFVSSGRGCHPSRTIDNFELIFVRQGRLMMGEEDQRFEIAAGQTLILWPGRRHFGVEPYPRNLSFYWVHFSMAHPKKSRNPTLAIPQSNTPERPGRLAELFHRFLDDQEANAFQPGEADLLIGLMLIEAGRPKREYINTQQKNIVCQALNFISANFHKVITAGDIARTLHLNPDYLGRTFHQVHGLTLTEAIHRRKIAEARSLLRETSLNIEEISQACGFADSRYFRRLFTRHQGVSPLRYRQFHTRIRINTR